MLRLLLTYHRSKDDPINHNNFIDALMMTKIEIEYNDEDISFNKRILLALIYKNVTFMFNNSFFYFISCQQIQ